LECDLWPLQWKGTGEDIPYGQGIVEAMRPFIEHLIAEGISDGTLKKHAENLWLLGGELIRDVSLYEEYGKIAPADKVWEALGPEDGPICRHLHSESAQRSFDATCRKLYRFLERRQTDAAKTKTVHRRPKR